MEFVFAYAAGLLTLINPCVLPVLPIVLATALQASRWGPVALALGLSVSFVVLGVTVAAFGHAIGLTVDGVSRIGAGVMVLFGAILLIPQFSGVMATATAGLSARADAGMDRLDRASLRGQALGGVLLGAVWSPCIGPTLGSAIGLASQGESLGTATLVMVFFALGVSTLIVGVAYVARGLLSARGDFMRAMAMRSQKILGGAFLFVGLALFFQLHHYAEGWLLSVMPDWLIDLSVSI
ncbi:MAG: cytochrome c biogenesis CcdA family protein [Rhodobacteraceae bacterium]|nr:cytochrome c biogenesis CcdA family protein [Paracoccaceae bacterium]